MNWEYVSGARATTLRVGSGTSAFKKIALRYPSPVNIDGMEELTFTWADGVQLVWDWYGPGKRRIYAFFWFVRR